MMKKIVFIFGLLLISAFPLKAEHTDFMSGFEDLPLMSGLAQQEDAAVSFDSPSGRIIEAYAESSKIEKKKIIDFYDQALPQLGWKRRKTGKGWEKNPSYARDGEILDISIENGSPIVVRFELTSQ